MAFIKSRGHSMQKTRKGFLFASGMPTMSGRLRTNYTNGYFERSQKRSSYGENGHGFSASGSNRSTSLGFTAIAVILLFLIYPVGLVMIWNRRVAFSAGVKLVLTLLAAVVFCLMLVYVANLKTNNPQLMKVQNALNKAFDWIYDGFDSGVRKVRSSGFLKDSKLAAGFTLLWDGTKENVARLGIEILKDKASDAEFVRKELPGRLLVAYKSAVGYEIGRAHV